MAFFNKIGNKAKEIADITKVNQKIGEERKRIVELKTSLAELVINKFNCGAIDDPDIKSECSRIKECYSNIDEYNAEINRIKAETEAANRALSEERATNRNASVANTPTESTLKCSQCGTPIVVGQKFCVNCGASVKLPVPESQTEIESEKPRPAAEFCANCGTRLSEGQRFCSSCGSMCR